MLSLNLPVFQYKIKEKDNRLYIYDVLRRKYIVLQPEEWVRQHVINYLLEEKHISRAHIKVEQGQKYQELQKRCDVIVWDNTMSPLLLVECKAPNISLNEAALFQAGIYNSDLKARFIWLTNGLQHRYFRNNGEKYIAVEKLEL